MPKKKTGLIVEKVVDQSLVANTVAQFLEVFKNSAVEKLMSSGLSKEDLNSINQTLNSELESTKSKAYEYVSKL